MKLYTSDSTEVDDDRLLLQDSIKHDILVVGPEMAFPEQSSVYTIPPTAFSQHGDEFPLAPNPLPVPVTPRRRVRPTATGDVNTMVQAFNAAKTSKPSRPSSVTSTVTTDSTDSSTGKTVYYTGSFIY